MRLRTLLGLTSLALPLVATGCVATDPGYGYGYAPGYAPGSVAYAPAPPPGPVIVPGGGLAVLGFGGGHPEHRDWDRDRHWHHDHDGPRLYSEARPPHPASPQHQHYRDHDRY